MKTTIFFSLLISFFLIFSPDNAQAQSTNGGKPKQVINGPVSSGTPSKVAKKTSNRAKKSVLRKSMSLLAAPPPSGAREKKQNKTNNRPKKYIRI
jgi:hypothetical protein